MTKYNNTYTLGRIIPATGSGYNQLPALFNDSWFNSLFKDLDRAFDVPNAVYPYNVKVVSSKKDPHEPSEYIIEVALAGVGKDNIKISVKEGVLHITVDKDDKEETEGVSYVRRGISERKGEISFTLNSNTDIKKITSNYVDGLLRVTVPVKQPEVYNVDVKVD